jgi:hypothetical protein
VVTITKIVPNVTGNVMSLNFKTVIRTATGEYEKNTALGSPNNQLGNDPVNGGAAGSPTYPNLWANVFGPASLKGKGDAILPSDCTQTAPTPDNCQGGSNLDRDSKGYFLGIDVPANAGNLPLNVQVFDPAFVHVGDNCGANMDPGDGLPTSNLQAASTLPANFNPLMVGDPVAPSVRYDYRSDTSGFTNRYCTGDMYYTEAPAVPTTTTYVLRRPDNTPADPSDNPQVCAISFGGRAEDIRAALLRTTMMPGEPDYFVKYFRQWYPVCSVANAAVGTYYLQVTTAYLANGSAAPNGGGANRLAVRAGLNNQFSGSNLTVYGESRLGFYANAFGTNSWFHLARLLPGGVDRALILRLYDIGDAAAAGTLKVLPPVEATNNGVPMPSFSGCTWTQPPGNQLGPPWGTMIPTASDCSIGGVSVGSFDRQWIEFRIPVPAGYDCDYNGPGCWTRIQFSFPTNVNDTTTWTAGLEGDPVRLVK